MAQIKKRGLGRGLDALLAEGEAYSPPAEPREGPDQLTYSKPISVSPPETSPPPSEGRLAQLSVERIHPGVHQPRVDFDDEELAELAESVRLHGVLQPILVKAVGDGYEIVAGERRWRASHQAGLKEIPAIVVEAAGEESLEIAVIENIQRSDLNPMEEAAAYESMMNRLALTQEEVAARVGKNRSTVANYIRLLRLPASVQEDVASGDLSMGHARALLSLRTEEEMMPLVQETERKGLSVRQLEARVRKILTRPQSAARRARRSPSYDGPAGEQAIFLRDIAAQVRSKLGAKVLIQGDEKKGQLVIEYYSADMLEDIVDRLS